MTSQTTISTVQNDIEQLNHHIIEALEDGKAKQIVKLDLTKLEDSPARYFIICHADSTTAVNALADNIIKDVEEKTGDRPSHVEGRGNATWVLVDYFDTVIHIFYRTTREYYKLETLWGDAEISQHGEE